MPYLLIQTNTEIDNEDALLSSASNLLSQHLRKAERYIMCSLAPPSPMIFNGSDAPAAHLQVKSIGLPTSLTSELSTALCEFMETAADIPRDRVYIEFVNVERAMWGWNGATF